MSESSEGNTRAEHWSRIYRDTPDDRVSWHQDVPEPSLGLIRRGAPPPEAAVLDVGGGASRLVDHLLSAGYRRVSVLDVSARALDRTRRRLGPRAAEVEWIQGDATDFRPTDPWDVWHDRAMLHFLTDPQERAAYHARLLEAVVPGGCVILGTFGPGGPERCSGLPCVRYDVEAMSRFLGEPFELEEHRLHEHTTPGGGVQQFLHARFRRG